MKIKFEQLEPGMLTDRGLIVNKREAEECKTFTERHIKFFDIDAYYGQSLEEVHEDDGFEILHEPGTKEYKAALMKIIETRVKAWHDAENDVDLLHAYLRIK